MYYFLSDTHFGDDKIIQLYNRPFKSVDDMNQSLIKNINARIDENDILYFLGDFCMKKSSKYPFGNEFSYYRNQIKCKNIIFVEGKTHDHNNGTKTNIESIVIEHGGCRIYMTHNPKFAKEEFKFNFTGHLHGQKGTFQKLGKKSIIVDLSVENWNYYPVDINEIIQAYSLWLKQGKNEKTN
jgi:calcineurin-like phosphoesterase family protein